MKKLLVAALLAGSAFSGAGVAHAAACNGPDPENPGCDTYYDCGFNTVAQEDATGGQDTFTGAAYGYVVSTGAVSIRCFVEVDGSEVASTGTGTGTGTATTAGPVTYTASDTQTVELCAEWTGVTSGRECFETTTTQIPPQVLIDLINDLLDLVFTTLDPVFQLIADNTKEVDVLVCTALKAAQVPTVINATTAIHGFSMDNSPGNDDCDIWDETTDPRSRVIDFWVYDD